MRVYLDNNTASMTAPEVLEVMKSYFSEKYATPSGLYGMALEADEVIAGSRERVASSLNAPSADIHFTSSGSEANFISVAGVALANRDRGRHLITTKIEHPSVQNVFRSLEREGFKVDYLPVDHEGIVDLEVLKGALSKETILASIMTVNHVVGSIQPIKDIADIVHSNPGPGTYLHTDAVAGYGKIPIDVHDLGIDALSINARVINGPPGMGAVYVRKGTRVQPVVFGSSSTSKLRPGSENVPGIAGFAKAVDLSFDTGTAPKHSDQISKTRDYLVKLIEERVPEHQLNGPEPGPNRVPDNANYSFTGVEGEALTLHLDMNGIAIATGSACASRQLQANYVLLAMGRKHEDAHSSLRFTLSRYNTVEEMEYVSDKLSEAYDSLRKISVYRPGMDMEVKGNKSISKE